MGDKMRFPAISESERHRTGKFLLGIAVAFVALFIATAAVPVLWFEYATAVPASALLNAIGVENEIVFQEPVLILIASPAQYTIQISWLCTGVLEIIVVISAVLASFGISGKKRIFGALGAIVAGFAFNQARIVASIMAIVALGAENAELAHDVLFRIALFAVVAGYYTAWFWWATAPGKK